MDASDEQNDIDPSALFRSFSLNMESSMSPDNDSNGMVVEDLAVAVVDGRKIEEAEAQERANWRRYFDPWVPSEYAHAISA